MRADPLVLFAGQLTGVEGYTESTATGLLAAINLDRMLRGAGPVLPPPTTMLGALYRYLREADPAHFQPMNANFGLLEELAVIPRDKARKRELYAARALERHARVDRRERLGRGAGRDVTCMRFADFVVAHQERPHEMSRDHARRLLHGCLGAVPRDGEGRAEGRPGKDRSDR